MAIGKKTIKKSTARKKIVKKIAAKDVKKSTAKKVTAIKEPYLKSEVIKHIAEAVDLNNNQVTAVFDSLYLLIHRHLKKGGAGSFTLPGMIKCFVKRKPAAKSRKGTNPFTGESMTFKAKPAHNVVKVRALKKLKEMSE